MARSLSLAAYLAYSRRSAGPDRTQSKARPDGSVIWAHVTDAAHADALLQLLDRLRAQRPDTSLVLTSSHALASLGLRRKDGVTHEVLSDDTTANAEDFLNHWSPNFTLWTGGDLQPAFIESAAAQNIPMALIDADAELLMRSSWRWFPDLPRALMRHFEFILARDDDTGRFLRRMGVSADDITITGRFLDGAVSLPCNETAREEMAEVLIGRPVWLAARLLSEELQTVLQAHREIAKRSVRAMLIVVPDTPEERDAFLEALRKANTRFIQWSEGEMPDEYTQVILADTRGEMGLWYRLAPVSFMGNSLVEDGQGCDPNEPAAHGSAILFGPNVQRYAATYARFSKAGAARVTRNASGLAGAVIRLLQPDQSAQMAHAAWEVSSRNAALTDMIAERVLDYLDRSEAG